MGWEGIGWVKGSALEEFVSAKFAPCLVKSQKGRNQPTALDRSVASIYANTGCGM